MKRACRRRLVCADAEALPFPESTFTHVLAADLLENTRSPAAAIGAAAAVHGGWRPHVSDGEQLPLGWTASGNRSLGGRVAARAPSLGAAETQARDRHPACRELRQPRLGSADGRSRRAAAGRYAAPLDLDASKLEHRSALFKALAGAYSAMAKTPVFRSVLLAAGPMFQSMFVKEKTL